MGLMPPTFAPMTEAHTPATKQRAPLMWTIGSHHPAESRDWSHFSALIFGIIGFAVLGIGVFAYINTDASVFRKALLLLLFVAGLAFALPLLETDRCIVSVHFNQEGLMVNALEAVYPGGLRHPVHFCVPWAQVKLVSHQNIAMDEYGFKTEDVASFQVMGSRGRPYQFSLDGFNKEGAMIFVSRVQTAKAAALLTPTEN